jgi:hypothetical protein
MPFDSGSYLQARAAGSNALAAGITSAAGSIADGITKHTKAVKELKALKGSAVDIFGMDKAKVDQMSAEDLREQMSGTILKQQMDRNKAQMERQKADDDFQAAQRAAGSRFQSLLQPDYVDDAVDPVNPRTPSGADIMRAAAETGYQLDPRVIAQFAREGEDAGKTFDPRAVDVGGVPMIVQDKTGMTMVNPVFQAKLNAENKTKVDPSLVLTRRTKALADWNKLVTPIEEKLSRAEANLKNAKLKQYHPQYESDIKGLSAQLRQLTAERPRFDDDEPTSAETAAPAAKPAQGGYKIGTRYSGLTYMGGDPKQESSWQK